MITIEQLKDVKERTAALERYLDIENKLVQVEEEQLRTQAPGFWDDAKKAEAQMKKVKEIQKWIDGYREVKTLSDELELSFDFFKDDLVTEEEVDVAYSKALTAVESLELKNMLRQEADQMDCVLKINSGAGGTESQDWASMLMRMYMRWAETNGYKLSIANLQEGDEAGIKAVTMNIEGSFAYGYAHYQKDDNFKNFYSIIAEFAKDYAITGVSPPSLSVFSVPLKFDDTCVEKVIKDITLSDLIQAYAELTLSFAVIDADGKMRFKRLYSQSSVETIDSYKDLSFEDYELEPIRMYSAKFADKKAFLYGNSNDFSWYVSDEVQNNSK